MHRYIGGTTRHDVPNAQPPDIAGRLLLEISTNLLNLGLATGRIVEEIAELAAVGLDVNSSLGRPGIALEHQDLVLGATFLLDGIHGADPSELRRSTRGVMPCRWGGEREKRRRRWWYLEE